MPPPLSRLSRQIGPSALEGFEDEGLVRLDDSAQRSRLVGRRRAEKPMPPAEGRRRMNAAQLGGLRQAPAFDHRSGMIEPTLLLAQMRHGRFGQRVERASATLAAEPQQPVGAAPTDDLAAGAMRAASAFHPLMARHSKRILAGVALSASLRRGFRQISRCRARLRVIRLRQRLQGFRPLLRAQAPNRQKPTGKLLIPHRINPPRSDSV